MCRSERPKRLDSSNVLKPVKAARISLLRARSWRRRSLGNMRLLPLQASVTASRMATADAMAWRGSRPAAAIALLVATVKPLMSSARRASMALVVRAGIDSTPGKF
jgi:hypothetical protein